ncbi:MAG: alpha/beta hydrolase [Nocardioides sp.]
MEPGRPVLRLATGVSVPHRAQGDPDGLPCLLVHAWCESSRAFGRVLPRLPSWVRAHTIDLRGHGHADKPPDGYRLEEVAADVVAALDILGLSAAVLVGASSGGYVAHQVAVSAPTRVRALALIGSPYSLAGRPPFADAVDALRDPIDPAWVRESLAWFPTGTAVPAAYVEDRVADALAVPAAVWRASLTGLTSATAPSAHGALGLPGLLMWGERDEVVPPDHREALAAALPESRVVVVPGAGHLVLWERPGLVAEELVGLLAAVAGRGPADHYTREHHE